MRATLGYTFTPNQVDTAINLLGMPGFGHPDCPILEAPLAPEDGGRAGETALTMVAEDFREAVAIAMQLAALVCDPEEVADLHTRMSFRVDRLGRQRYQFRGYHVEAAPALTSLIPSPSLPASTYVGTAVEPTTAA